MDEFRANSLDLASLNFQMESAASMKRWARKDWANAWKTPIPEKIDDTSKGIMIDLSEEDVESIKAQLSIDHFKDLLSLISSGGQGLILVQAGKGFGIITDGDLRRSLQKWGRASFEKTAMDIMTSDPIYVDINSSYHEMETLLVENAISTLLVRNNDQVVGLVKANSLLA